MEPAGARAGVYSDDGGGRGRMKGSEARSSYAFVCVFGYGGWSGRWAVLRRRGKWIWSAKCCIGFRVRVRVVFVCVGEKERKGWRELNDESGPTAFNPPQAAAAAAAAVGATYMHSLAMLMMMRRKPRQRRRQRQ